MTSYVTPKINTAFVFYVSLEDAANPGKFKASPTLANGDVLVATGDGAPGNAATLPVVDADFTKRVKVSLSAGEMNGDNVTVIFSDAAGAEWFDLLINIQTTARQIDDLGTSTYAGADTAGTTTLLSRIVGTLATGTHNPQTGDAYAIVNHATYGNAQLARTGADSDTLKTLSDQIDTVSAAAIADAVLDEILSAHDIEDSLGNVLNDLTAETGGTYAFTAGALALAPGGGGTLYSYSGTVDAGSNPLDGVFIQCATNANFANVIGTTYSNASGAYTVRSDTAGTHYLRFQLAGYNFSDETVTLA